MMIEYLTSIFVIHFFKVSFSIWPDAFQASDEPSRVVAKSGEGLDLKSENMTREECAAKAAELDKELRDVKQAEDILRRQNEYLTALHEIFQPHTRGSAGCKSCQRG